MIRVLLLLGFLKGSEGVRTLLMIGAFLSIVLGGALGMLEKVVIAGSVYSTDVGAYMLWALRRGEVQRWMLDRSLGGLLDDDHE